MYKKRFGALCLAFLLSTGSFLGSSGTLPITHAAESQQITPITYMEFLNLTTPADLIKLTVTEAQAEEMRKTVNEIIAGKETDYEKAQAIHGWIAQNVKYENGYPADAYAVFKNRSAVCGGFSNLMVEMMHLAGIPCVALVGLYQPDYYTQMPHQWNGVYLNEEWILADGTAGDHFDLENMHNTHITQEVMGVELPFDDVTIGYYRGLAVIRSKNTTVTIPEKFENFPITSISYILFGSECNVEHITIGKNVSFLELSTLKSSAKMKSINVVEGNSMYCSIDGILFSADKTQLLAYPFDSDAKEFTLPKETIDLDMKDSFSSKNLENIYVEEGNTAFSSYDGALYNTDKSTLEFVPAGKTIVTVYENASIGGNAFSCVDTKEFTIIAKPGSPAAEYAQQAGIRLEEPHEHKITLVPAKEATCKEAGNIRHYHCENCGLLYEDEKGEKELTKDDIFTNTKDHSFSDWEITTPATCKEQGVESRTCTVCNETETRPTSGPLKDHSFSDWEITTPPTCKEQGVESRTCTVCNETETRPTSGSLKDHSFSDWKITTPATCKEQGVESRTCTVCNEAETRATSGPLKDHSFSDWKITTPATCKEQGVQSRTCTVCNETETRPTSGPLKDHSFSDWTVTTPASLQTDGVNTKTCQVCKTTETQAIPKIATVELEKTSFSYTGKNQTVNVIVKDSANQIISPEYYTVSGNTKKNPGKYTVKITFVGKYAGNVTETFEIQIPETSFSKVKATKNTITLNWKAQKSGIKGYKIQYSTDKKFKKNVKTVTIKKKKIAKTTLKKLKSKKKYYVRICTYKGKTMSKWSKVKVIKTK